MLHHSHDSLLVIASLAVAFMAGFSGLSLTHGASALDPAARKRVVAMAAVALGGGIWSMHFVAMLGLRLPEPFYYDALVTLISAFVAILIVGLALLLVHFRPRTAAMITAAGALVGLGIPAMHYIGMAGMEVYRPTYTPFGVMLAVLGSVALCIGVFWVCYGQRARRNIWIGTAGFAVSVFAVHFIAMAGTAFELRGVPATAGPLISNEILAFAVTTAAFVICGAFLLSGITFTAPVAEAPVEAPAPDPEPQEPVDTAVPRVPFERDGRTHFIDASEIAAIRAEGHYTFLYKDDERLVCPWSITETEQRVPGALFVRTHRSYLVNSAFVTGFERKKDTAICYFDQVTSLGKVPVSRSRMNAVRAHLGV